MSTHQHRIICCALLIFTTACALIAQLVAPNPLASTSNTLTVAQPIQSSAALAEAQAAYQKTRKLEDNIQSYFFFEVYLSTNKRYDLCLEECNQIMQRWPTDKTGVLTVVTMHKSYSLAQLKRWAEAYDNLTTYDQQQSSDRHTYAPSIVPNNFSVHESMLVAKTILLSEQRRFREAAATVDEHIAMFVHPTDDEAKAYVKNYPRTLNVNVDMPEEAALWYSLAGEYDAALTKYQDILLYMKKNLLPTAMPVAQGRYLLKQYYTIPVEMGLCQMQAGSYSDALKTYNGINATLNNTEMGKKIFVTFSMTNEKDAGKSQPAINIHLLFNKTLADYFLRVDLAIHRAECLLQLKSKAQALAALNMASEQLKEADFSQKVEKALKKSNYATTTINKRPLTFDLNQLLPVKIPALRAEINRLP